MFTYLKLKNFKSLVDVEMNFIDKKKNPKKLVILYGENGSGKSNIASAFYTLAETLRTMEIRKILQEVLEKSNDLKLKDNEGFIQKVKESLRDIETIIKKNKTINSNGNMVLEVGFNLDGDNGNYILEMDNDKVVKEILNFKLEKNKGNYFNLSQDKKKINNKIFKNNSYYDEIVNNVNKFWGKHTLLSILINELDDKVEGYLQEQVSLNFWNVIEFLNCFSCQVNIGNMGKRGRFRVDHEILMNLNKGSISIEKESELNKAEELLNELFTRIYADIKNVYYDKEIVGEEIQYSLYCKKLISNEIKDVNFELESTGTQQLLDLIPHIMAAVNGQVVIIDEFDSGVHDLLVKNLIESINESIRGQLIITTHNTLLMESEINPESLYFIVVDSNARKKVLCISDFEDRTHPNNNIRNKYLKGMYKGIPDMMDIDFDELLEILE